MQLTTWHTLPGKKCIVVGRWRYLKKYIDYNDIFQYISLQFSLQTRRIRLLFRIFPWYLLAKLLKHF